MPEHWREDKARAATGHGNLLICKFDEILLAALSWVLRRAGDFDAIERLSREYVTWRGIHGTSFVAPPVTLQEQSSPTKDGLWSWQVFTEMMQ